MGRPHSSDKKGYRWGSKYLNDYKKLNETMIVGGDNIIENVFKTMPDEDVEELIGEIGIDRMAKLIEKMKKKNQEKANLALSNYFIPSTYRERY